jgi:CPA1 family monovalent cation:H+ antiporter
MFRALGVPKPLAVLMEGESLLNDGTAIVVFNVMVATALPAALTGVASVETIDLVAASITFLKVAAGGTLIGSALGWMIAHLIARVDDYLIETTLTTVLAYGAYLVAERLHVSGVLAVVAAGIFNGTIGTRGMSPTTRIVLYNFWEYLAFLANSLVFLLIGLAVNLPQLLAHLWPIGIAIAAVVSSRAVVVYGLSWVSQRRWKQPPRAHQHVLFWGGLRGAISLALVLSLPATIADREVLQTMAFGVVLFTLLVQGTTMSWLLRRLGLVRHDPLQAEYERRSGRLLGTQAAAEQVDQLYRRGLITASTWDHLKADLDRQLATEQAAHRALLTKFPVLHENARRTAQREGLRAKRAALTSLASNGLMSDMVANELLAEVDAALQQNTQAEASPPAATSSDQ